MGLHDSVVLPHRRHRKVRQDRVGPVVELVAGLDVDGATRICARCASGFSCPRGGRCPQRIRSFDRCMDTRRIISNYLQGSGVSRAGQSWGKSVGCGRCGRVCSGGGTA